MNEFLQQVSQFVTENQSILLILKGPVIAIAFLALFKKAVNLHRIINTTQPTPIPDFPSRIRDPNNAWWGHTPTAIKALPEKNPTRYNISEFGD